jgi:hypothetical protein
MKVQRRVEVWVAVSRAALLLAGGGAGVVQGALGAMDVEVVCLELGHAG